MAKYLWVKPTGDDRKVIVSEADPAHPLDENGTHEVFIAAYPDAKPTQVGDTGLIRRRIAEGVLVEVTDQVVREQERAERARLAAEKAAADQVEKDRIAAEKAAQGAK